MHYRPLGKTGLEVSEIGFGAWGIGGSGWIGAQEDESVLALRRAIELGVNFIDTARGRPGRRCARSGRSRGHRGDPLYVATKVPPKNRIWPAPDGVDPAETFPGDHIRASLETSLRASGLEAFDVLQFHVWSDAWLGRGDWLETIEDLKREGKIRFFGVSINDYQPDNALELVSSGHVDTVQIIYNAFHQAPEERLLPACAQHGVGVIVRVALDEGGLTGRITPDTTFQAGDFRNGYFGGDRKVQVKQHVDALTADLGIQPDQIAEVALRYVLSQDAVSTVIAAMRTVRNVERNAAVGDGRGLCAERQAIVARHRWERDFYQS